VPVQTSFEFMQNLVDDHGITWESAGLMGRGRKVFISAKLPEGVTVDAEGVNDHVEVFLVVQDDRTGGASYKAMVTPWVPRCQNTNRFALRDALAVVSLRHTTGLPGRIEKARLTLGMSVKYAEAFAAEETVLARAATTQGEAEALLAEFFTEDGKGVAVFGGRNKAEESTRTAKANDRREDDLMARWAVNKARLGDTLYAVEQVTTEHLDWGKVRTGTDAVDRWQARIEASLAGQDDGLKTRAHARLMQVATTR
jgi:phage/plasmid-like protein (TIGR03299 family)